MQTRRTRWVGGVAIGMLAIFAVLSLLPTAGFSSIPEAHDPHDRIETTTREHVSSPTRQTADATGHMAPADATPRAAVPNTAPAPEREALRRQILASAHAHEAPRAHGQVDDEPVHSGQLTDRIGGSDPAFLAALNADFMPLADECMTAAMQANPELRGMVAMGLELAADDELGTVVETVDFSHRNEVDDLELQTCLRETALSMLLPPSADGLTQLLVTMPLDDEPH